MTSGVSSVCRQGWACSPKRMKIPGARGRPGRGSPFPSPRPPVPALPLLPRGSGDPRGAETRREWREPGSWQGRSGGAGWAPGPAPSGIQLSAPNSRGGRGGRRGGEASALTHAPGIPGEPAPSATPPPWAGPSPRGQGEAGSPAGRGGRRPPPPHGAAPPGSSTCCPAARLSPSCLDLPLCLAYFFHRWRVGQGSLHPCVVNRWWGGRGVLPVPWRRHRDPVTSPLPAALGRSHVRAWGRSPSVCGLCSLLCEGVGL